MLKLEVEVGIGRTNPVSWQPIQTNTLSGTTFNFADLQWRNFPYRFYRVAAE
jgi:hypothetical protein